jgi:hypothetical protein
VRLIVALSVALFVSPAAVAEPAASFVDTCGGCHTIGGGDLTGPDLTAATSWAHADVRAAVDRMQDYAGPLTPQQIDEITGLLTSGHARELLTAETARRAQRAKMKAASPATGRKLFFGEQRLSNGGLPCFACHTAAGQGGNLAADLTAVHTRMGETPLLAATEKPNFPLMKRTYAAHPVTPQEALHLAAFFAETATATAALKPEHTMRTVQGTAAGVAIVLIGAAAFFFRPRR